MDLKELAQQAITLHQQGNLAQAEALYLQILQADPALVGPRFYLGVMRLQQQRFEEAADLLGEVLQAQPDDIGTLINHGMALRAANRSAEALVSFDRAARLQPNLVEALYNRGVALSDLQRYEEAVDAYNQALVVRPGYVPALGNLGAVQATLGRHDDALATYEGLLAIQPGDPNGLLGKGLALDALGRREEALAAFDQSLLVQPGNPQTLFSRGVLLGDMGRADDALASFEQALASQPDYPDALNNRGTILFAKGRISEALSSYDRALSLSPRHVQSLVNRANLLRTTNRSAEALADYETLLTILPQEAEIWHNRGVALREMQRNDEALSSFDMALNLRPDFALALHNRGYLLWSAQGDHARAVADLEKALQIEPDLDYAQGELLHLKMYAADWSGFGQAVADLEAGVRAGRRVVRPFAFQAISQSPADLQACSTLFAADHYPAVTPRTIAKRDPHRLRVGYVSGEFREQATAYLMAGLYEAHDRGKFEVIAIDTRGGDNSPMRARLEKSFDRMLDISGLSDDAAADLIQREEIDILVNLNGYFGSPRMGVFARKPAPVQVNYLGFPATLGAPYMDYIIADKTVIPDAEKQFYTEQVVTLPGSYQVNDSRRAIAPRTPSRAEAGLPESGFVFCNFNQSYKLTPDVFASWMRILKAADGSVLWLLDSVQPFAVNLRRMAQEQGVDPSRLVFAPSIALEDHLARLKLADLFLDEQPYNAHTTASDALWAGVPLLTCRGSAFPGRVAASLLMAAGLPELIADDLRAYEAQAITLAGDAKTLAALRAKLAANRDTCPLFDTDLTRRHLEAAYAQMWAQWQAGKPPAGFAVKADA